MLRHIAALFVSVRWFMDSIVSLLVLRRSLVRAVAMPALAILALSFGGLSSSSDSHADESLFARPNAAFKQVWSGALRCAVRGDDDAAVEQALESGSVPAKESRNYSECGRQALRNTGSRIIVDTIEDVLHQGGLAVFEEGFRLDSSLNWVFGSSVQGEVDVVLPIWSSGRPEGEGNALFLQPGAVFWQGLGEEVRTDANLGLVYRSNLASGLVAGGSIFYDHGFRRGHSRLGIGADVQSGMFHGAFNYYHPLTDQLEGREDNAIPYFERTLRGLDVHLAYRRDRLHLGGSLGYWRFEGEDGSQTQWHPSYEFDAGFRVLPGVFVEGRYEHHEDEESLGPRWSAGMSFEFSLPNLDGATGAGGWQLPDPDLWRAVEREKRILYEEYERGPGVSLRYEGERNLGEGSMVQMTAVLSEAFEEDIVLHLVGGGTADYGTDPDSDDWQMGYRVVPANETARPDHAGMTECAEASENAPCAVTVPAGDTRVEVRVMVHNEGDYEGTETIRVSFVVPPEHAGLLAVRDATQVFTIGRHLAPPVTLAYEGSATVPEEGGAPMTMEVRIGGEEGLPEDITIGFTTGGTADFGSAPNDWFFQYPNPADPSSPPLDCDADVSNCTLTIPAGETSASITVNVNNDDTPENPETLILGITLPAEYEDVARLGVPSSQTVTITASEKNIAFGAFDPLDPEPARLETDVEEGVPVEIEIALDPSPVPITLALEASFDPGGPADADPDEVQFPSDVVIPANTDSYNFTFTAVRDGVAEFAEEIFLNIRESSRRPLPTGWSILRIPLDTQPDRMRIEIAANENTVVWNPARSLEIQEDEGPQTVKLVVNSPFEEPVRLRLLPTDDSTAVLQPSAGEEGDYMYSVTSGGTYSSDDGILEIPAHGGEGAQEIEITIVPRDNPDADGDKTVIFEVSESGAAGDPGVPSGWRIGTTRASSSFLEVTIVDDEPPNRGRVAFARSGSRVTEGSSFDIPISVTGILGTTFDVMITAHGATGDAKIRGTSGPGIETPHRFAVSSAASNLGIDVADNSDVEGSREIVFTLTSTRLPPGVRFGSQITHTLVIVDDDADDGTGGDPGGDPVEPKNVIGFASSVPIEVTEDGVAASTVLRLRTPEGAPFTRPVPAIIPIALKFGDDENSNDFTINFADAADGSFGSASKLLSIAAGQAHPNGNILLSIDPRGDEHPELREEHTITIEPHTTRFPSDDWEIDANANQLTIHIAANDNTIAFEDSSSSLENTATTAADGIKVKILVDLPHSSAFNLDLDVTGDVTIDSVANGTYDAANNRLVVDVGAPEVTLTVISSDGSAATGNTQATLAISKPAGQDDNISAGWEIGGQASHAIDIVTE